jgi:hypothetical protein
MSAPLVYVTAVGIDGRILLRVFRGNALLVEAPLRPSQAMLLLSDLANLLTIAGAEGFITDAAG